MGVAPPGTLARFARWGASPSRLNIYHLVINYALVTVTNNYANKNKGRPGGEAPPSERSEPAWWAAQRPLVLPEKQYQHHNRHWYCQHQV